MIALVTGASSGMGLEYARQLAGKGHDLVIVSNQEKELGEVAERLASEYGVRVIPRYQDLATDSAADELHAFCEAEGLEVDILVNNAGMFFWGELGPESLGRADAMMHLHMVTPTRLCILFGEDMKKRGRGWILNMSSMAAKLPTPGITVYSATKAYLRSFGKSLWFELHPYDVNVTTVMPAAIATPLYRLKQSLMDLGVKTGVIKTPRWLVRRALRGLERGRKTVRPGFMNVYLPFLVRILPARFEGWLWKKFK